MSFLGSLFTGPNTQQLTQNAGVQTANNQAQNTVDQQQAFANALAAQNGIQNQASVFNQLQGVANGTGPNPAQAALAQSTGQNVANQAALMAGQRNASQNAGLIAREAGQQGAATQQQAAGQAATMQANQSLGALGQLSGIAGNQVNQQAGALGQLSNDAQNQQNNLSGQINSQNNTNMQQYQSNIGLTGSLATGLAGALVHKAHGGMIEANSSNQSAGLKESYPKDKKRKFTAHFADGGPVQKDMKMGGHVPGKAAVGGAKNDYANDTVPAMLSPGEAVLPRSVMKSDDPVGNAAKFVEALLKKKGKK